MCFFEKIDQTQDYRQKEEPNVKKKTDSNIQCSLDKKKSDSDHVMFIQKNWLIKHETIIKRKSLTLRRRVIQNIQKIMFVEKKKSDSDQVMFIEKNWLINHETIVTRKSLTLRRRATQNI